MRKSCSILIVLIFMIAVVSCEDEKYESSSDVRLGFSREIITFDTVFPVIGSATQHLKIYNSYDQTVLVSAIRLASGNESGFKLNINGVASNELYDVEILPGDSIYIFVEVDFNRSGEDELLYLRDSIEFITNENSQDVDLVAWGQDVIFVPASIGGEVYWTADKPYLVNVSTRVERDAVLHIAAGTRVYFHNGSGLYVRGTVIAKGTSEQPVVFQGDRQDLVYRNLSNQWKGILLFSGSHDNVFDYTEIRNANIGLQVGTVEQEGAASAVVSNSRIYQHAYAGIFALRSKLRVYNTLITDCGYYGAALLVGGEYEFYHTTIANYQQPPAASPRTTASLMISDHVIVERDEERVTYTGDLNKAFFANSIVSGDRPGGNELELARSGEAVFNYRFDHCLLQLSDTFDVSSSAHFQRVLKGADPGFQMQAGELNFRLDSLSPARDAGSPDYALLFPFDPEDHSRTADAAPDLGAYEWNGRKDE